MDFYKQISNHYVLIELKRNMLYMVAIFVPFCLLITLTMQHPRSVWYYYLDGVYSCLFVVLLSFRIHLKRKLIK